MKFCSETKLETWKPVNPEESLQLTEDQTEQDFAKSESFEANDSAIDDLLHDQQDSLKVMENSSSEGKKQPVRDPRIIRSKERDLIFDFWISGSHEK